MSPIHNDHPLRSYFTAIVEQTFCERIGVCSPPLTDYLSNLLVDFTHVDQLSTVHHAAGKSVEQLVNMLTLEIGHDLPPEDRDREIYRQLGDFSLFWTGVYPEQLVLECKETPATLHEFRQHGRRSYAIASELARENTRPPSSLFRELSQEFDCCVRGLSLVREELAHRDQPPPGGNIRIVY